MVSLLTPQAEAAPPEAPAAPVGPPTPEPARRTRPRHRQSRSRFDGYPFDPFLRNLLRLAFAVPFIAVAIVADGEESVTLTGNWSLLVKLARFPFGSSSLEDIASFYPPVSSLAAAVIPGGSLGLGIVGALIAGLFLQKLLEIMVQRQMSPEVTTAFLLAVGANPLFAYLAVGNLPVLLGMVFFGVGLSHMRRFISWGSTRDGFLAGLLFMLAALSDSGALLYVVTAAAAAPFLPWRRGEQRGARAASIFVLLFPTASAFGSLVALELLFRINPVEPLIPLLSATPQRFTELVTVVLPDATGLLLAAPVAAAWILSVVVRRPGGILASTLVFLAILGGFSIGLVAPSSAGSTFLLMMLLAITLLARPPGGWRRMVVIAVVLAHVPIAWATALDREVVASWIAALVDTAQRLVGG